MAIRRIAVTVGLLCLVAARVGTAQSAAPAAPPEPIKCLQPFVDDHTLGGAVLLVASNDKILSLQAIGCADVAAKTPMRTDQLFWIASMSKAITATALMMLVDEGKVKLDDRVEKYLPDFASVMVSQGQKDHHAQLTPPAHPITVWNLLTHTSGLEPQSMLERGHLDRLQLRENVQMYPRVALHFEPGSKYEYCNAGINTAGRIVELVSGMPFERFLQDRLFTPLGMKDTTFRPSEEQVKRLAKTYTVKEGTPGSAEQPLKQLHYPLSDPSRGVCPAGGLFSTAEDICRFCQMIMNKGTFNGKTYLTEAAVRQMTTTQYAFGKTETGYGFGWRTMQKDHGQSDFSQLGVCEHGGAEATLMRVDRPNHLITVLMVQYVGPRPIREKFWGAVSKAVPDAYAKH